jgi:hypothetical protein
MEIQCVWCEIRTEFFNIAWKNFVFESVKAKSISVDCITKGSINFGVATFYLAVILLCDISTNIYVVHLWIFYLCHEFNFILFVASCYPGGFPTETLNVVFISAIQVSRLASPLYNRLFNNPINPTRSV